METLDELRKLGCSISVTTTDRFFVQLTLMHGDDHCGHTARAKDEVFDRALGTAVKSLLAAATGSTCKVDVEGLRRIAAKLR